MLVFSGRMNGLFITGTDTGVGKTALAALLFAELRHRGMNAAYCKPVQTGCSERDARSPTPHPASSVKHQPFSVPDLDYALSMAAMKVDEETCEKMAPYRFEPACSPHLAAEMAGVEIDIAEIVIAVRTLSAQFEFIIAEGAGGVLVPLNPREAMLDLMQALRFPVLVAARPGLGTINHTLLTLRTLRADGLEIAGVVLVAGQPGEPGFIEENNATTIERLGKVPVLGTIPYCHALASAHPNYNDLPIPVVAETEKILNRLAL